MVLKKKEIIAASLVVLIGVAGYLNWSYQDTIRVQDGESYTETGRKLGEAQYVSSQQEMDENGEEASSENGEEENQAEETSNQAEESAPEETVVEGGANYFEEARMNRESARSKSLEILNQTAENESFDAQIRQKAGDKIIAAADNQQKEAAIESIAQSKGYAEICVFIDDNMANVMVRKDGFSDEDAVRLTDIVTGQTEISAQNVKIVEVK